MGLFRKKDNRQPMPSYCVENGDCSFCKEYHNGLLPCHLKYARENKQPS